MKIVLLEGLGVSRETLQKHARRLEAMGHMFTVYERDPDPGVQAERCRDADVLMLANMPLAPSALEAAKELKFINVAFTGVDHIPMAQARQRGIAVSNASGYATQAVAACDVFETEPPLPADHPLLHCPNTIVTPHIGFASAESMEQRADIVFENLAKVPKINAVE